MGLRSIDRFERFHKHQRHVVPSWSRFRPGGRVYPDRSAPDKDHFGMTNVKGLPARHFDAERAERLGRDIFSNFSESHHRQSLVAVGLAS